MGECVERVRPHGKCSFGASAVFRCEIMSPTACGEKDAINSTIGPLAFIGPRKLGSSHQRWKGSAQRTGGQACLCDCRISWAPAHRLDQADVQGMTRLQHLCEVPVWRDGVFANGQKPGFQRAVESNLSSTWQFLRRRSLRRHTYTLGQYFARCVVKFRASSATSKFPWQCAQDLGGHCRGARWAIP